MEEVRHGERLKMWHWLKQAVDSGEFHGVEWTDKERGKFRIPWKHASRHGWDIERDARIFKMWAVYTGKYSRKSSGLNEKEKRKLAKNWKANFRCALNALQDIEVVHKEGKTKGRDAYKVFRLLPQQRQKSKVTKMRLNSTGSIEEKDRSLARKLTKSLSCPIKQKTQTNAPVLPVTEHNTFMDHSYTMQMFQMNNATMSPQIKTENIQNYEPDPYQQGNLGDLCQTSSFSEQEDFVTEQEDFVSSSSSCTSDSEMSEASKLIELFSFDNYETNNASDANGKFGAVLTQLVNNPGISNGLEDYNAMAVSNKLEFLKKDIPFYLPFFDFTESAFTLQN